MESLKRRRKSTSHSCFYKLMLCPSTQSKKLRLPEKFATAFSDELASDVILTVPRGESRKVALIREDKKLWFHDGWQEFVEYFSIGFAYFLLFKYEGNSTFRVHIFNLTGCEISYKCNPRNDPQVEKESCQGAVKTEVPYEEDINDVDDDNVSVKSLDTQPITHEEVIDLDSEVDDYGSENEDMKPSVATEHSTETNDVREFIPSGPTVWLKPYQGLLEAVAAAGISLPKNPFFISVIKKYNLHKGMLLHVPIHFGCKHLGLGSTGTKFIKLEAYDGWRWEVRCIKNHSKCLFSKGWIMFARQIGLEVQDICIFELSNETANMLNVLVVKKSQIKAAGYIF